MSSYGGYLSSRELERIPFFAGYLRDGLSVLLQRRNFGFAGAFDNVSLNQSGLLLSGKEFVSLCSDQQISLSLLKEIPDVFHLSLRYSPIAQFKRWIFSISNRRLISVLQRDKLYERDLFLLDVGGDFSFIPILNNIAHERCLLDIYECFRIPETHMHFRIAFKDREGLAVYRSYRSGKISFVKIPETIPIDVLHQVRMVFMRNNRIIRYRVYIGENPYISHTIRFSGAPLTDDSTSKRRGASSVVIRKNEIYPKPSNLKEKEKTSVLNKIEDISSLEKSIKLVVPRFVREQENIDYEKDVPKVLEILQENDRKEFQTNRFANVSLGRVSKIPILLNLSAKYINCTVRMVLDSKEEVSVYKGEELVKKFTVLHNPKSNWLGKRPKVERSK